MQILLTRHFNNQTWITIVQLVGLMLFPLVTVADETDKYQKSLKKLGEEISAISQNLNANKALLKTEQDKLFESEQALSKLGKALQKTTAKLKESERRQAFLQDKIEQSKSSQKKTHDAFLALVRSRYKQGQPNYIKLILNQENPYAVGRLNNYHQILSRSLRDKVSHMQLELMETVQLQQQQDQLILTLNQQKSLQEEQKAQLKAASQARALSVAKLNDKVEESSEALTRLIQDRERLDSLLLKIKEKAAELKLIEEQRQKEQQTNDQQQTTRPLVKGGFVKQKGRLRYPVTGKIKIKFGDRVAASGMRSEGILYQTNGSIAVKSIFRGSVLFADYLKGYGLLLIIDHGDEHISLYGHNESLNKKVGDLVQTGEVISRTGVSGGLKEPGLYFEIRDNASPVNPSNWFQ